MRVDVVKVTDTVLKKMGTDKEWPWDIFWKQIAGQRLPVNGNKRANFFYLRSRIELKDKINRELAKRRLPNRLFVIRKFGLYLVDEKKVTAKTIKERQIRMTACVDRSIGQYNVISKAKRMSKTNVALLENRTKVLEESKLGLFITPRKLELIPDDRNFIKEIELLDEIDWVLKNANLSERERDIFILHRCDGVTLKKIGQEMGLSRERIRQILAKTQRKFEKLVH